MPSPFPYNHVIRECSWNKTQIKKKKKISGTNFFPNMRYASEFSHKMQKKFKTKLFTNLENTRSWARFGHFGYKKKFFFSNNLAESLFSIYGNMLTCKKIKKTHWIVPDKKAKVWRYKPDVFYGTPLVLFEVQKVEAKL